MRTAIFILAMQVHEGLFAIAESMGYEKAIMSDRVVSLLGSIFLAFIIMDLIDFANKLAKWGEE